MTERPILFSGPMVRAILYGKKTMTRRVMKPQPPPLLLGGGCWYPRPPDEEELHGRRKRLRHYATADHFRRGVWQDFYPYGQPGDRLWVRETWGTTEQAGDHPADAYAVYRATDPDWETMEGWRWRPSIFMPRWASRITLEITGVRVERVQEISEAAAKAEGVPKVRWYQPAGKPEGDGVNLGAVGETWNESWEKICHRNDFANLWDSLNAKRGYGWESNPWVWVIEFRRMEA